MPHKRQGPLVWLAAALAADAVATVAAAFALARDLPSSQPMTALAMVSLAGAAVLFGVAWKIVDYQVVRNARRMAAEVRALAFGGSRTAVDPDRYPLLAPLPEAFGELASKLDLARRELAEGIAAAAAKAEETASRLAAILNDLHEAVVVCNLRHQVVLYNAVAMDMLSGTGPFGLGRSLFETVSRDAVVHMLDMLTHRADAGGRGTPFLAGGADGRLLLQARMTLIRTGDEVTGYVVTMVDASPQVAALAQRDALLREVAEGMEMPLLRLRMATDNPAIVEREAGNIDGAIRRVTAGYHRALASWWPMTDLYSADFFTLVARRFEGRTPVVNATGLPVWLHADSHSLALALASLIEEVSERFGLAEVDLAAICDEQTCWLEIGWAGATAAKPAIDAWLAKPLPLLGGMTVRDVLLHHAGDGIEQEHRAGQSWLKLPMRKGVEVRIAPKPVLPTRPEFYDLDLLKASRDIGEMGALPLRSLTFVVFDTETTGLQPSQGDQIVQIGGVRVVNGRILSGENFNRIVHPGRSIPKESIRFHGITDEMVKDKPPIAVVLPQFKAFCADSVLVAHNAAFDLKFLRMREKDYGVRFDNPVLDTMIMSSYLDGPDAGHSLDEICDRYGLEIADRHTALGDAMVTAAVLLRQIEAFEARGLTTLDQVVKEIDLKVLLHQRQRAF
ncbi:exonuclease domain-containing protein [Magnetospirillum sp. UT-4]|uniref:3'-5' exonuclease n=1 Tax=Magnetospirillum sp. UT-4 TaxID=2681467 RepID=UPI00138328FA|nr:exonuclease domain-containing protein [Magnetospirillum sp. UT-4]CAA7613916.1 putative DNA polymerase III subunit epsilon-like protein [Magnetospirillum sp. UT-4]